MTPRLRALGVAGVVALVVVGATTRNRLAADVASVEPGVLRSHIAARAVVVSETGVSEVRARIDGRVVRVEVREGEHVRPGQLLAEIEAEGIAAELSRRRAEQRAARGTARAVAEGARSEERRALDADLAAARAELGLARLRAARQERLAVSGAVPPASLDAARTALEVTEARYVAARARRSLGQAGGRSGEVSAATARVAAAEAAVD